MKRADLSLDRMESTFTPVVTVPKTSVPSPISTDTWTFTKVSLLSTPLSLSSLRHKMAPLYQLEKRFDLQIAPLLWLAMHCASSCYEQLSLSTNDTRNLSIIYLIGSGANYINPSL